MSPLTGRGCVAYLGPANLNPGSRMMDAQLPIQPQVPAKASPRLQIPVPPPLTLGPTADMRRLIESYGLSHPGNVRSVNEDHFVTAALQRSVHLRQTNLDVHHMFEELSRPRDH